MFVELKLSLWSLLLQMFNELCFQYTIVRMQHREGSFLYTLRDKEISQRSSQSYGFVLHQK